VLIEIAKKLDNFLVNEAREAIAEAWAQPKACRISLVGQMALFENDKLALNLIATRDVDALVPRMENATRKEFIRLLKKKGFDLDPLAHEAWMPKETKYDTTFAGRFVTLRVAEPDAVLVSKALKAPAKNRKLIREYIAQGASERFFDMAEFYEVDLEQF